MNMLKCNKTLFYIILGFFALQIIILFSFGYTPYPDSDGYILLAQHSLKLGQPYPSISDLKELKFIWNVGAINAVELSLYIFNSIIPLLIIYTIMKVATAFILYKIAETLFNKKVAFINLILYIIYPANYGESTSTLSEVPFLFFITLGILLALKYKNKYELVILGGCMMAIANWFRPLAIVFLLSMSIYYVIIKYRDYNKSLYLCIGYLLMIGIIGSISYQRTGHFIYQARTGWQNLMQYSWDHNENKKVYSHRNPMYIENSNNMDCLKRDSIWKERCLNWIIDNPKEYLKQIPSKIFYTYISDNVNMCALMKDKNKKYMYGEISMVSLKTNFPYYTSIQLLTFINLLYYYTLIIAFIVSCINMIKHKDKKVFMPLLILTLGTMSIALVAHGEARFHNPYMPFIILAVAHYIYIKFKNKINSISTFFE